VAAGCCHEPQNIATVSGALPGNWVQFSPLALVPSPTPSLPAAAAPPVKADGCGLAHAANDRSSASGASHERMVQ
jgi:hypothetical protein